MNSRHSVSFRHVINRCVSALCQTFSLHPPHSMGQPAETRQGEVKLREPAPQEDSTQRLWVSTGHQHRPTHRSRNPCSERGQKWALVASSLLGSEDMLSAFWGLFRRSAPLLLTDSFWDLGEPSYSAQGHGSVWQALEEWGRIVARLCPSSHGYTLIETIQAFTSGTLVTSKHVHPEVCWAPVHRDFCPSSHLNRKATYTFSPLWATIWPNSWIAFLFRCPFFPHACHTLMRLSGGNSLPSPSMPSLNTALSC